MKGKAIIQLFDENGKETYRQEHKNIITNSYQNLIFPNFPVDVEGYHKFGLHTMTPLHKKMFGGIMLFSDNIEANADNFMIGKKQFYDFVGSAGGPFAGDSIYKGSFNETESSVDTENKQVVMVWDFPSNAGNGKIKCIGLCPRFLGDAGLIKDVNDDSRTSLLCGYGSDFTDPIIYNYPDNTINSHYFPMNLRTTEGYYLYSKSIDKNVYVKENGKKYTFTEVQRSLTLGLADETSNEKIILVEDNKHLCKFSTFEYACDESVPYGSQVQYDSGYIYFITFKVNSNNVIFNVYKLNPDNYTLVNKNSYTFYMSLGTNSLFTTYMDNKIYLTVGGPNDNLYICDLGTLEFKTIPIGSSGNNYCSVKFFDTIMLVNTSSSTKNIVYILDSNDNLVRNVIYTDSSYNFNSTPQLTKIFTNDDCYNYPIANVSCTTSNSREMQNQIVLPHLSSINNVDEFVKYPSNTMKITYVLSEY